MSQAGIMAWSKPRTWGDFFAPVARVQLVVIVALLVLAYWTPIRLHLVHRWLHDGNWSHGPIVPFFSLYFLIAQRERLFAIKPQVNYFGAVLLAGSLAAYFLFAFIFPMAYPQDLTIPGAIAGLVLLFGGWNMLRVTWFPILFLLFALPLPESIYVKITMPLREFASMMSAPILELILPDLEVERQAVVIDFMYKGRMGQLYIEDACSGMRLTMSFLALGVAMAYLGDRPIWQRVTMIATVVPIAIFCNIIRVTTTGVFTVIGRQEYAQGTPHQLLGIAMLGLALGLFALIGYFLDHLFVDEPDETGHATNESGTTT